MTACMSQNQNNIPRLLKARQEEIPQILQFSQHANDRGGEDRACRAFVIEADIAARYRGPERPACVANSSHRFLELPEHLRLLGIPEVQAIRYCKWLSSNAHNVSRALSYSDLCTQIGIQINIPRITIGLQRKPCPGPFDPHDRSIAGSRKQRVCPDHGVILPVDPAFGSDVGAL